MQRGVMLDHPLRAYRHANGLTLKDLAARVRASTGTISRIENGRAYPRSKLLLRILNETALTADHFFRQPESAPGERAA
jgi:transcriptional regulator with XRE-family HTH domain